MLLALPHIWFILIRADQLANLGCEKTLCGWGPVVIVSDWCLGLELKISHNLLCPLAVSRVRSHRPEAPAAHRPYL